MYPPMAQNAAMTPQNPATRPTPQQLAQGLQQMPMVMQRQPQGGMAGPNMTPQMPNQFTTVSRGLQVR